MGVCQFFGRNARTLIDGVVVTEYNEDELIAKNVRHHSEEIIKGAISAIDYLWSGLEDLPERDRIVGILNQALIKVNKNNETT